jgi:hypothetical protein
MEIGFNQKFCFLLICIYKEVLRSKEIEFKNLSKTFKWWKYANKTIGVVSLGLTKHTEKN